LVAVLYRPVSASVPAASADKAGTPAQIGAASDLVGVTGRLGDYQTMIAAAVEEQTAATDETSRNIARAAAGSAGIAANMSSISAVARVTAEGVPDIRIAAEERWVMSRELRGLVVRFRV
jgi:methyl-accepting chemotaxis protein